jgi:hypothetical protein
LARESFTENPNKVSSIFFNWASLIIHGEFCYLCEFVLVVFSPGSSYLLPILALIAIS